MGHEEQIVKHERRRRDHLAKYTGLAAVSIFTVVTWITVLRNDPSAAGWFAFHPFMQTLSICFLAYGILTLQPTSQPATKSAGLVRHQISIFLLGFPCIMLGSLAVMYNKWLKQKDHLTTWHGTFGMICLMWLLAQVALGGGSVWFGGSAFGGGAKAKATWKYHRLSGYLLFSLLLITAHLGGGWSQWGVVYMGTGVRVVAYTLAPALLLVSLLARVRLSKMKFF